MNRLKLQSSELASNQPKLVAKPVARHGGEGSSNTSAVTTRIRTPGTSFRQRELRNRNRRVVRVDAMGMHGPPFASRRAFPLVKRAKKLFVAEKISGFIQLERAMQ